MHRKKSREIMNWLHVCHPSIYMRLKYLYVDKKMGHFNPPKTFHEKLIWLELFKYWNNKEIMMLEDKYLVREYLIQNGYKELLNELYFVWEKKDDFVWEQLPNSFALKLNIGCGKNIICNNKNNFKKSELFNILESWLLTDEYKDQISAGGSDYKKVILCEKNLNEYGDVLPIDYKFYCFNGIPQAVLVIWDRLNIKKAAFMSRDWKCIKDMSVEKPSYGKVDEIPLKPKSIEQMFEIAEQLSKGFPFVRIDLYEINGSPMFGEFTFRPGDGVGASETLIDGVTMGELLKLTELRNNGDEI